MPSKTPIIARARSPVAPIGSALARLSPHELGQPLLGATLTLPGDEDSLTDADTIRERLEKLVDLIIDGGFGGIKASTVIDLTGMPPVLVRAGRGPLEPFGLEA